MKDVQRSLMMSDDAIKCFLVTNIFGISDETMALGHTQSGRRLMIFLTRDV